MFILIIFRIVSQSQPYFPGSLNIVFHLHCFSSVPASHTHPPLALPSCLTSRPFMCCRAQSWVLIQLTTAWLHLHAKDTHIYFSSPDLSASIRAWILTPSGILALLFLRVPHAFSLPYIWTNSSVLTRALPVPYCSPLPQLGVQKPSQSLLISLLCSLSTPRVSAVIALSTLSCNCP